VLANLDYTANRALIHFQPIDSTNFFVQKRRQASSFNRSLAITNIEPPSAFANALMRYRSTKLQLRDCIGSIITLQERAESILKPLLEPNLDSPFRASLEPEEIPIWDEMQSTHISTQRWSDGLVSFSPLGDTDIECRSNGIYGVICFSGIMCFLGLASGRPVRGAVETAWGVEIHKGELYGAVVARSYEIESKVAQYPRIVVGPETIKFLEALSKNDAQDIYSRNDQSLAKLCLNMLIQNADGHWMIHYLGKTFRFSVTTESHATFYTKAMKYITDQLSEYRKNKDTKLAFRYANLMQYFEAFPASE